MTFSADVATPQVWGVGALCQAAADVLQARFNPVTVRGELSNVSRASSGHVYFSLKDAQGQLRCAMFRRAASLAGFTLQDGQQVEARGRLSVYEARGDLQLVVESLTRAGQGALYERFLRLKTDLDAQGLFDATRKRPIHPAPRAVGVVTSLGAAALHDVVTALRRRAPHVPVVIAHAPVQGVDAPAALVAALEAIYLRCHGAAGGPKIDTVLLVRGGGSMEDLWAFNDEALARCIVRSPVPLISGVGHDTDVTIADFCADVRAATPTAAAELAAWPLQAWMEQAHLLTQRLQQAVHRRLDQQGQRLDQTRSRLGRPSTRTAAAHRQIDQYANRMQQAVIRSVQARHAAAERLHARLTRGLDSAREQQHSRLHRAELRLQLLDPKLVLQRGYAWIIDSQGQVVTRAADLQQGQALRAVLADGAVDMTVNAR